ncbi:MAG: nicotinamide mononucleotide transporter, partial [Eubacterium sp.]|nr:nicotinamide mononucleotide transporter [Eubacterium sp.]
STLSVFTSFLACVFLVLRLPYYALAYSANDVVLIVLWVLATLKDVQYLPMIVCFSMFLVNDLYGFYNWRRMKRRQSLDIEQK